MIASNVMRKNPITLPESGNVSDAIKLFRSTRFHTVPIVDNEGRPVGYISALGILHAAVPGYANASLLAAMESGPDIGSVYKNLEKIMDRPIADVMNRDIHPIDGKTATSAVAAILTNLRHETSTVFVVDDNGKLIGIISAIDIVGRSQS